MNATVPKGPRLVHLTPPPLMQLRPDAIVLPDLIDQCHFGITMAFIWVPRLGEWFVAELQ